ncbi:DUF2975 domain-containing protein [Kitasatospora sp. NPDC001664]
MGRFTVRALRAVLGVVFTGTVLLQVLMVWTLVSGSDPEDGTMPLTALRVIVVLGMLAAQVALHAVWRLVAMVRRGTVFSHAAFGHVNRVIGSIVAVALLWFVVTGINAPGQREDPGVTVIMAGIGLAILGVALVVLVLRMLLDQATQLRAELDEVI